jgi:hypothetical protein
MKTKEYQPKTGERCHCKPGQQRDNCPDCEGTGQRIDFAKIRERAKEKDEQRSERQAQAQFESIKEKVETLRKADESGTEDERDAARQTIHEDALSVEVRSDRYAPGSDDNTPSEYRILLCTGGPACQIVGNLSEHGEPETARIEHQDWFTPWMEYRLDSEQSAIVVEYARCLVSL